MSCSTLCFPDEKDYPEAGPRNSFGLINLWMHAPEDRGYVPDCFPLDGDGRVQGGIGGGCDVDGGHHLPIGECTASQQ